MHGFSLENSFIATISHLFCQFHTFLHTFFKNIFYFLIRLLKCYKNIYGLHRFSITNSSKLAISHLFSRFSHLFYTPFSHFFTLFVPLIHTHLLKKIMLIATSVLEFCLGTNFVTPYIHTYIHTDRHLDHSTSSWPKGPRANKCYKTI